MPLQTIVLVFVLQVFDDLQKMLSVTENDSQGHTTTQSKLDNGKKIGWTLHAHKCEYTVLAVSIGIQNIHFSVSYFLLHAIFFSGDQTMACKTLQIPGIMMKASHLFRLAVGVFLALATLSMGMYAL